MRFGLHTSYIYGGHFVFVYPLLIGWLFYAYRSSPKASFSYIHCGNFVILSSCNNYLEWKNFLVYGKILSIKKAENFSAFFFYVEKFSYFASAQKILYCTATADLKYSLILKDLAALCFVK
jgi:hypothetical protein